MKHPLGQRKPSQILSSVSVPVSGTEKRGLATVVGRNNRSGIVALRLPLLVVAEQSKREIQYHNN